jgi:MFS family permease
MCIIVLEIISYLFYLIELEVGHCSVRIFICLKTYLLAIGNLAERFGGKWIFGGGILLSGIFTLLTPLAARIDYKMLIAVRILIGMASGPVFPSAAALWGQWVSKKLI